MVEGANAEYGNSGKELPLKQYVSFPLFHVLEVFLKDLNLNGKYGPVPVKVLPRFLWPLATASGSA